MWCSWSPETKINWWNMEPSRALDVSWSHGGLPPHVLGPLETQSEVDEGDISNFLFLSPSSIWSTKQSTTRNWGKMKWKPKQVFLKMWSTEYPLEKQRLLKMQIPGTEIRINYSKSLGASQIWLKNFHI